MSAAVKQRYRSFVAAATLAVFPALFAGCVSKSAADRRAREAFAAGQQAVITSEMEAQSPSPARPPVVMFIGPVNHPTINWSEGITLSHAILAAGYNSPADPGKILIHRRGTEIPVNPKRLLAGEDIPLQPGDVVEFQP